MVGPAQARHRDQVVRDLHDAIRAAVGRICLLLGVASSQSGAPLFFTLWGIPFVLAGVYLIVGRFFVEAKQRERTYYGVTNERVLILSGLLKRKVKSLSLRSLSELSLVEGAKGEGSISFGSTPFPAWAFPGWPGMEAYVTPRFDLIDDAKSVYDIIRAA